MTSSPELLRFFTTEAMEYLDALEGIVTSSAGSPDAGAFVAVARAMRGSATMARAPRISDIAFVLEQIGSSLREGELSWTVALQEELRDAARDLRALIPAATRWTAQDDQRALQRIASLRHYTPNDEARPTPQSSASTAAPIFIALQAAAIAGDLEAFVADSRGRTLLDDVVNRLRSLRGIAGVADHPPLGDVADAVERSLRALAPDALLVDSDAELFRSAAAVFRRASADLRARGRINLASGEIARFAQATAPPEMPEPERIVHIDDLFYADAGPHVVQRGRESGAATPDRHFRSDTVTRVEHLRRLVAEARAAADPISRDRVRHDLRVNLERIEQMARSINAQQIAAFFAELLQRARSLDAALLDTIESGAQALLVPNATIEEMEQRLALLDRTRHATPGVARTAPPTAGAPRRPGPAVPPRAAIPLGATAAPRKPTPPPASGKALHDLLQQGLSGLQSLEREPLSEPARFDDDSVVPIESLLYRGRSALQRAIEVRDEMRTKGSADQESLQELYDLLDLARAE
jgi:chemotaxis protein histidine kinase CheA